MPTDFYHTLNLRSYQCERAFAHVTNLQHRLKTGKPRARRLYGLITQLSELAMSIYDSITPSRDGQMALTLCPTPAPLVGRLLTGGAS